MKSALFISAVVGVVQGYTVVSHGQFMTKNIDALVQPGKYTSHLHSFFGSDAINTTKPTSADLQQGCYSGDNANDLSVYWIPTLHHVGDGDNFTEIKPSRFSTYYHIESAEVPFPNDFAAIAGDAKATNQSEVSSSYNDMSWWCEYGPSDEIKDGAKFPTKTCNKGRLQVILRFPNCVDLENLGNYTYADAKYGAKGNRCPSNMKRIPQLRFSVRYDVSKQVPNGWEGEAPFQLSCGKKGDGYCFHGDFINGWFDDAAKNMLRDASDKREFARVDGEHGVGSVTSQCQPTDADPENGTSDYKTSLQMMATN